MAQARKRFVVDENGRKESVLLPIGEYEDLLEDLEDLALMVERKDEPTEPLEDVAKRLEKKWKSTESS
jgi:PHD/YefM family antitoxin component YafN of YafNO toxin-antitoxin module